MKTGNRILSTLFIIAGIVLLSVATVSCSDDNDGVVKVNFSESSVAGTWRVTEKDSVVISGSNYKTERKTFDRVEYTDRYISFDNGNYRIWEGNGDVSIERGTYKVVVSSFRVDLSSGRQLHWLKGDNSSMTLEEYSAASNNRVARYTLVKN